ncbi:winged helix-turn-helix domain-containing protein [Vibrio sp. SS-MA-C1-2]|uniref:ArsR/SmtB family transcription factor n=1 Tax=Vibrio sp. SS-MA-C1-2 TaxID=2908646 RepID=UPI001F432B37|nr:winged helix-turn-helix domain-containing protein [Vibrio sp. SS-MA-C1-2]UJF20047.1 winged helix-turn-helix domain-containing protein [Vibrio sp. SS-MA-C1-2]
MKCSPATEVTFKANPDELVEEEAFALLAKALSHPARVHILRILNRMENAGDCLNSDLVSQLGLAQSTVSEHLRILKKAELITATPKPPKVCYRINKAKLTDFSALFSGIYR